MNESYDAFGQSSTGTSSLHTSDAMKLQEAVTQIEMALQVESQRQIMSFMNNKCFERCITKPTSSALGNSERQCIAKCMDRFQDGIKVVNSTIAKRLTAEKQALQNQGGLGL